MEKIVKMSLSDALKNPLTKDEAEYIKNFDEKFDDPECPVLTMEQMKKNCRSNSQTKIIVSVDTSVVEKLKTSGMNLNEFINSSLNAVASSIA